jgi:hypothetical protein
LDNLPLQSRLLRFVNERENIRIRKASGRPGPWTTDPVLAKYRFCNIRRRDDRVSQWLLRNYYPRCNPLKDIWLAAAVARVINWPPTLDAFAEADLTFDDADSFDAEGFKHVISLLKADGEKVYTGAYMIYPGKPDEALKNKEEFIASKVIGGLLANRESIRQAILSNSVENTVEALSSSFGTQTFMAGQIAADLTYIPGQLQHARDLYTYAPRGPGSQRGLNRLYGLPLGHTWTSKNFCEALIEINRLIADQLGYDDLTLHDVQNVMCEADKLFRVINGEGKPRSQYRPEKAY